MKKNSARYKNYVFAAMFAALILMGTMFIQIPFFKGYVHIGDSLIYLAATFLPMPFSILAASVGAALADILGSGGSFIIYAPFTFVIKGIMAICFSCKKEKILSLRNITALPIAGLINITCYAVAEFIILSIGEETVKAAFVASLTTIWGNLIQSVAASAIFVIVGLALDRMNFKQTIDKIS